MGLKLLGRIRNAAPESKILFLSQESDLDVARAALSAGAHGYVVKAEAEDGLIGSIEAVMEGKRNVTCGVAGHNFDTILD